jgi:hypothetical protein
MQLLATEDRVRDAAAETMTWKERAENIECALTATKSELTDITRERDFLSTRLQEREVEVRTIATLDFWLCASLHTS